MKYRKGFKYQLAFNEKFFVPFLIMFSFKTDFIVVEYGWVTILKGYAWDGPSGPTIDTRSFMRGSLIHDALYQLMRLELIPQELRELSDEYLVMICDEDGMWKIRQKYVLVGVEKFASEAAHPDNVKKIYTAP